MEKQLKFGDILKLAKQLKKNGMQEEDICNLPIYIGDDEELNGIHTAFYSEMIDKDCENDNDFCALIQENSSNIICRGNAILIS